MKTKEAKDLKKELKKMVDNLISEEFIEKAKKVEDAMNSPMKILYQRHEDGKTEVEIEGSGWALMASYVAIKKHIMKTVGCSEEDLFACEQFIGCKDFQ